MQQINTSSMGAYAYNSQVARDEDDPLEKGRRALPARSYKPLALRLPYILVQMFVLCVAMGLLLYAMLSMPDSDSSTRDIPGQIRSSTLGPAGMPLSSMPPADAPTPTRAPAKRAPEPSRAVVTSVIVTNLPTTVTRGGSTVTTTRTSISVGTSTVVTVITPTQVSTGLVTTVITSISRTTATIPGTWVTRGNLTITRPGSTSEGEETVTATRTMPGSFQSTMEPKTSTVISTHSTAVTATAVLELPPVTYLTLGPVTITTVYTIEGPKEQKPIAAPKTELVETLVDGETKILIVTQEPETKIVDNPATVVVPYTPPVETVVRTVGGPGSPAATEIVVTPTPEPRPTPLTADQMLNGQETTAFQPIVFSAISVVGGTPVTSLATVVTVGADGLTTTSLVTSVFMVGGTTVNVLVTTTPTGTLPLTLTVATTRGESLVTSVYTPPPTSVTTVISGRLTTIVSTPSPSTSTSTGASSTLTSTLISTPTPTSPSDPFVVIATEVRENIGEAQYFMGVFLPLLVCLVLAAGLRIIDNQAKLFQPFFALNSTHGATGTESLALQYVGLVGWLKPIAMRQPIPLLSQSILLLSSLMVPLSAEALGIRLHGSCGPSSPSGCTARLGVSPAPAYALIAVLAICILLLALLAAVLHRARTGLSANPWSVAGIASLTANPEIRVLEADEETMMASMTSRDRRYGFGHYEGPDLEEEYGVVVLEDPDRDGGQLLLRPGLDQESDYASVGFGGAAQAPAAPRSNPFLALTVVWRVLVALFLCGLFALVLYYHLTLNRASDFKTFMDSHSFGVRFLLALTGVVVTFCWLAFFSSVASIAPFQAMMRHSQPPERSILISRCSNGFYGLYRGIEQREPYTFFAALMLCLAEALPVVLSNIPYKTTQTLTSHIVCARISLAILGAMIVVLLASFVMYWPSLPADPRSVGGLMYYVTDSYFVASLGGISDLDGKARAQKIKELGRRYYYAREFYGRSGLSRKGGIDSDATLDGQLEQLNTMYAGQAYCRE